MGAGGGFGPSSAVRSVGRFLRAAVAGRVRSPRARVGTVVETDAGQRFTVYRETTVADGPLGNPTPGAVLAFRFHLRFMPRPVVPVAVRVFEPLSVLTTPFFAGLDGFRTKLWLFDHATGDYQGLYQWASAEAAEAYAAALGRLMDVLSMPGSVSYEVIDDRTLDGYLADRVVDAPDG